MKSRSTRPHPTRPQAPRLACGALFGSLALALAVYACSTPDAPPSTTDAATSDAIAPPPPPPPPIDAARDAPVKDASPPFDAGVNSSASNVLINEISGGDEWVELVNSGPTAEDLAGLRLADRDKVTGEPKLDEAITFPAGTTIAKGGYVLVRGGGLGDGGRPCPDGGQSHCFNAAWGISSKSGETLFLLATDGGTLGKVVFPPDGSPGDTSYSRIPSGDPSASFRNTPKTPGAANVP